MLYTVQSAYSQRLVQDSVAIFYSAVLSYAQRTGPSDRSVTITLSVTYVLLTLRTQLKFLVHRNSIGCCPDSFLLCARKSGPETSGPHAGPTAMYMQPIVCCMQPRHVPECTVVVDTAMYRQGRLPD